MAVTTDEARETGSVMGYRAQVRRRGRNPYAVLRGGRAERGDLPPHPRVLLRPQSEREYVDAHLRGAVAALSRHRARQDGSRPERQPEVARRVHPAPPGAAYLGIHARPWESSDHIHGQSNGAYTAARLALEHPEACASLILSDTGTLGPKWKQAERREELYKDIPSDHREALKYRWEQLGYRKGDVTDEYLDAALFMEASPLGQAMAEDLKKGALEANRGRFKDDKEETLRWIGEGRLTMPVLITWGANDPSAILPIGLQLFDLCRQMRTRWRCTSSTTSGTSTSARFRMWSDVVMNFWAHNRA